MKKYLLFLICILLVQVVSAQDVIVKINGDEIKGKVTEINLAEVLYQSLDSTDSTNYSILKSEVFMVRFANGTKEVFQENLPVVAETARPIQDPSQMYLQGQQDARSYYRGEGAMWGSAASMFLIGPVGPVVIGAVKPKAYKNPVPTPSVLQDQHYVRGYENQAHKRKIGKAAIGAGIGTAALFALILLTVSAGH